MKTKNTLFKALQGLICALSLSAVAVTAITLAGPPPQSAAELAIPQLGDTIASRLADPTVPAERQAATVAFRPRPVAPEHQYVYRMKVVRVIDGDTVVVDIDLGFTIHLADNHVRLIGVAAPEITRPKDAAEKEAGLRAKAHLEELLQGKEFLIETYKDSLDAWGRSLGYLWVDGRDVNSAMRDWLLQQ